MTYSALLAATAAHHSHLRQGRQLSQFTNAGDFTGNVTHNITRDSGADLSFFGVDGGDNQRMLILIIIGILLAIAMLLCIAGRLWLCKNEVSGANDDDDKTLSDDEAEDDEEGEVVG